MLIKFQSKESASFVMFGNKARQLLAIIGYGDSPEGAIIGDNIAMALSSLEAAIAREPQPPEPLPEDDDDNDDYEKQYVSLKARAAPLLTMLRKANEDKSYVMWQPE